MFKKLFIAGVLSSITLFASSINIAVAANVSYAMPNLIKEFKRLYPDVDVKVTLGSSGKLTAQIKNGAPYDLFMAANMKYPQSLYESKHAITKPVIYAQGALALLSSTHRTFNKGIEVVNSMLVKRIALANPKTAPYGKAAKDALLHAGLYEKIKKKLIYAESISQTVSYTLMGADLGFIAKSSLFSPKMKKFVKGAHWIDVDPSLYTPIDQGIVILKRAQKNTAVEKFYQFMLSKKAKVILERFGYQVP